jgi:hypothetical protein
MRNTEIRIVGSLLVVVVIGVLVASRITEGNAAATGWRVGVAAFIVTSIVLRAILSRR